MNTTLAFGYYLYPATNLSDSYSQRMVGLMFGSGIGVKRDYAKALTYLTFSQLGNDLIATQTLAYYYDMGIGVEQSCDLSSWYYSRIGEKSIIYFIIIIIKS